MSKAVCQNTLPFHSHRKITARFETRGFGSLAMLWDDVVPPV